MNLTMMRDYMTNGLSNSELFVVMIHWVFMFMAFAGGIMLAIWMFKNIKAKQLLTWIVVAIVVGLLGSYLTFQTEMKFFSLLLGAKEGIVNMMQNR